MRTPILGILCAALTPLTVAAVIVTTALLDVFAYRPMPASLTTLFPGLAYATKTFMLVSFAASLLVAAIAITRRQRFRCENTPSWALLSFAAVPLAPLAGAFAVLMAQRFFETPRVAQTGVLAMLACVGAGLIAGLVALARRQRPGALSALGVVTNASLIGLFRYFEFYKLGFDQDRWASGG